MIISRFNIGEIVWYITSRGDAKYAVVESCLNNMAAMGWLTEEAYSVRICFDKCLHTTTSVYGHQLREVA